MRFRIEFPASKSKYHESLLRACGKFKSFRKLKSFGLYSVTLNEHPVESLHAVFEMSKAIAGTLYYCDNVLFTQRDIYQKIWALRNKGIQKEIRDKRHKFMQVLLPAIINQKKDLNLN